MACPLSYGNSILIGAPADPAYGNCIPLGCTSFGPSTVYQQVYSSTNFSGPLLIKTLTFYNTVSPGGTIVSSDYTFSLSTTTAAVNGLSSNWASNLGADKQVFWQGTLGGTVDGSLNIVGTPFDYKPSAGNLLLEIRRVPPNGDGSASLGGGVAFNARNGTGTGAFSRISDYYNYTNTGYNNNSGLITGFSDTTAVPEPGTLVLFSAGLAGLYAWRRKRRT